MSRMLPRQGISTARVAFALVSSLLIFTVAVLAEGQTERHPIEAAKAAIKAKNDKEALQLLSAFVRSNATAPEAVEARFLLGQTQARQRQVDEAFRTFSAVMTSARGTEWAAKALEETAKLHETRRNRTGAQQARDTLLRDYPSSPTTARVWIAVADSLFKHEQYREAAAQYAVFEQALNPSQRRRFLIARALEDAARRPDLLFDAAESAINENELPVAIRMLEQYLKNRNKLPRHTEALAKLGWAHYRLGSPEAVAQAEKYWNETIRSGTANDQWVGQAKWHMVQLLAGPKGEWQQAAAMCESIIAAFPKGSFRHEQAMVSRAWLYWAHQDWSAALNCFEDLLQSYPEMAFHAPIQKYLAECREKLGITTSDQ